MKLPHSVSEVLRDHIVLESEGIDRMYLNVYVPQLQRVGGVVWSCEAISDSGSPRQQRKRCRYCRVMSSLRWCFVTLTMSTPCSATKRSTLATNSSVLGAIDADEGVLYVGRAQEKARVVRTERRRCARTGIYPWVVGLIERLPKTHRYRPTGEGLRTAMFYMRIYSRLPRPAIAPVIPVAPLRQTLLPLPLGEGGHVAAVWRDPIKQISEALLETVLVD